jgi:hypothetical protein
MMIFVGAHHGGPELDGTPVDRAITAAMRAAIDARSDQEPGSAPAINIVFCTPGSITGQPKWNSGRVVRYLPKSKLLLIQVAVPVDIVASDAALDFVIRELHGANALAFEFFRRKQLNFPLADAERMVSRIQRLAEEGGPP